MTVAAAPTSVLDLADSEFVLLTTYTRDGRAKPTAVWAARDGDALVVITGPTAWKVRRVQNQPRVTLARSDMRGHPRGAPVEGVAVVVTGPLARRVEAALLRKYGWQMRLTQVIAALRPSQDRAGIVVRDR